MRPTDRPVTVPDDTAEPWVWLRSAVAEDLVEVAELQAAARRAAPMPGPRFSLSQQCNALAQRLGRDHFTVAVLDDGVVGYARFTDTWLDDLYVDPLSQGQGIGSLLLSHVRQQLPGGFGLWVFEANRPARAFYASHGLVEHERTDGSENDEQEPEVRMSWRGAGPGPVGRSESVGTFA